MAATVCSVVAADVLFYNHTIGWTAGLFTAGLLFVLVVRPAGRRSRRAKFVAALAVLGLALSLVEEPTPLSISVTSIAIVVLAIVGREGWTSSVVVWIERLSKFVLVGWCRLAHDTHAGFKWAKRHPAAGMGGPAAAALTLGKWVVPVLFGSVFVWLFSLANPIVEIWVARATTWASIRLAALPDLLDPLRMLFWFAVLVISWALFRVRTRQFKQFSPAMGPHMAAALPPRPAPVILPVDHHGLVERCLIVFNLIFAVETALDVFYLYGGRHLPAGMTFKAYAHRGSYPLIATALLAAAFVLIAFREQCNDASWRKARLLVYAWILQNVVLAFSAGWRLRLLVDASNLTRLRLATAIWLVLVAAGLISIVWRIVTHRDNAALLRVNIAMTAMVLYACCFPNLDGFIADYNARHCQEVARNGDVLGLTYLRDLGIESIPALDRLSHTLDTPQQRRMAAHFAEELRGTVRQELRTWRGWTWRRSRLGEHSKLRVARSE